MIEYHRELESARETISASSGAKRNATRRKRAAGNRAKAAFPFRRRRSSYFLV
jgi:hypothetical protein